MWMVQGNPWVMKIIIKNEGNKEMLLENNDIEIFAYFITGEELLQISTTPERVKDMSI